MTDFNHSDHSKQVYNSPKGYDDLIAELKSNHFYPQMQVLNQVIVALHIECPGTILIDDKVSRLKEILGDWPVTIKKIPNEGQSYIKITLKK